MVRRPDFAPGESGTRTSMCAIGPSRNPTPQSMCAAAEEPNCLYVFGRRECVECKADFSAIPRAVHRCTRVVRRKFQRRNRCAHGVQKWWLPPDLNRDFIIMSIPPISNSILFPGFRIIRFLPLAPGRLLRAHCCLI